MASSSLLPDWLLQHNPNFFRPRLSTSLACRSIDDLQKLHLQQQCCSHHFPHSPEADNNGIFQRALSKSESALESPTTTSDEGGHCSSPDDYGGYPTMLVPSNNDANPGRMPSPSEVTINCRDGNGTTPIWRRAETEKAPQLPTASTTEQYPPKKKQLRFEVINGRRRSLENAHCLNDQMGSMERANLLCHRGWTNHNSPPIRCARGAEPVECHAQRLLQELQQNTIAIRRKSPEQNDIVLIYRMYKLNHPESTV